MLFWFFVRRQPMPWLGLLVAIPYLVIVVGMGYSRQAIALGLFYWHLLNGLKKLYEICFFYIYSIYIP